MSWRDREEDNVEFEAKIVFETAKAFLVEPTIGEQVWVPKSQIKKRTEADMDGNTMFTVTRWWAERNNYA